MNYSFKKTAFFAALGLMIPLVGLSPARSHAQETAAPTNPVTAVLTDVDGDVSVIKAQDPAHEVPGEEEMQLSEGDKVVTKAGAAAEITFDDDSTAKLDENSALTIDRLAATPPTAAAPAKRQISLSLVLGRLFAVVKKAVEGGHEMTVQTGMAVAAVKGTEFGVEAGEDSHIGVYDGKVAVSGKGSDGKLTEPAMVTPNQETSVGKDGKPLVPHGFTQRWLAHREKIAALRRNIMALRELKKAGKIGHWREMHRLSFMERMKKLTPEQRTRLQQLKKDHPEVFEKVKERVKMRMERQRQIRKAIKKHRHRKPNGTEE